MQSYCFSNDRLHTHSTAECSTYEMCPYSLYYCSTQQERVNEEAEAPASLHRLPIATYITYRQLA